MLLLFPKNRRSGVFLRALLVATSLVLPAWAATVKVISSDEMDFTRGLQSVLVELRAGGYEVEVENSDALEPGRLLEVLQVSGAEEVVANVAVVEVGRSGIAYVWLKETDRVYRVTATGTDPIHAANVLSLRVSELISLRGEGFEVDRAAQRPEQPEVPQAEEPESLAPRPVRRWHALALLGPHFDSGFSRPLSSVQLAVGRDLGSSLVMELMGHSSLGASTQHFDQGRVSLEERGAALGLAYRLGERIRFQLGPTLGGGCFLIRAQPDDRPASSRTACRMSFGAQSRLGWSWDAFSLWVSGQIGYATRRVNLVGSGEVLARLSRPDGALRLGVGWNF